MNIAKVDFSFVQDQIKDAKSSLITNGMPKPKKSLAFVGTQIERLNADRKFASQVLSTSPLEIAEITPR